MGALAALDVKLEEVGVLPKLTPQPVPGDVADEEGQMHNDRMEVCFSRLWLCTPRPPMQDAGILISKCRVQAWAYGCSRLSRMLRCVTWVSLCCFVGGGGGGGWGVIVQ